MLLFVFFAFPFFAFCSVPLYKHLEPRASPSGLGAYNFSTNRISVVFCLSGSPAVSLFACLNIVHRIISTSNLGLRPRVSVLNYKPKKCCVQSLRFSRCFAVSMFERSTRNHKHLEPRASPSGLGTCWPLTFVTHGRTDGHTLSYYWRASEASETLSGLFNRESRIYIYIFI